MKRITFLFISMILVAQFAYSVEYIDKPKPFFKEFKAKTGASTVKRNYHYPAITWGDSILAISNQSLFPGGVKLVDDPKQQIRDVLSGNSPFVRQTVGSGSMVLDALNTAGVKMELFHTVTDSSGGDVIVSRGLKNVDALKAKLNNGERVVFAIQYGGPHMGWLVELLTSIGHSMNDSNVVIKYLPELFGDNSPEEAIAVDTSIDLAFVILPSADALTIGEAAVPGLKKFTSTKVMNESIKDAIYVRSDWASANKKQLQTIRTAFIQAKKDLMNEQFVHKAATLMFGDNSTQNIADTEGLRDDAIFHTLKKSNYFMYAQSNLNNLPRKVLSIASEFAKAGLISDPNFIIPVTDWGVSVSNKAVVRNVSAKTAAKIEQQVSKLEDSGQGEVLLTSKIFFQPNQGEFNESVYGKDFDQAIRDAAKYPGAVFNIIGHVDPSLLRAWNKALEFKKSGNSALMKVEGYLNKKSSGKKYNFSTMSIQLIEIERNNVRDAAKRSSKQRANTVKQSIIAYAIKSNIDIDASRLVVHGDGAGSPVHSNPKTTPQFKANIRVEFKLTNYNAEISGFEEAQDF